MSVRVHLGGAGTLNLGAGTTKTKITGILTMIAVGELTLLGMQEGSDRVKMLARLLEVLRHPVAAIRRVTDNRRRRKAIREQLAPMGWRVYQPLVPGGAAVPIAYDNKTWQVLRARTILAVARQWVGAVGAGPTWAKPKVITVLVLRHRETGEVVEHLNTHMIPSAERSKLPEREKRARRRHYEKHAKRLARAVRRAVKRGHAPVVTLDANAVARSELVEPLRDAGLRGWTMHGTHGHRGIDSVLTVEDGQVVGTPAQIVPLHKFDHHGVVRQLWAKKRAA